MLTPEEFGPEVLPEYMSGPSYMVSGSLTDKVVDFDRLGKLHMLKLEDIALAIWVDRIRKEGTPVEAVDNRSFFKVRSCHDRAFSVLLEEGRPLMLDRAGVAKAMKEIVENDLAGREKVCPVETTMEYLQDRSKREKAEGEAQHAAPATQAPTVVERKSATRNKGEKRSCVEDFW